MQQSARSALGFAVVLVTLLAALSAAGTMLTGCETQALFEPCALDEEVTKKGICSGSVAVGHDTSSCVVTAHPQCDRSICLSYFGQKPICTMACTSDSECGAGSFCWTYADADPAKGKAAQRYCVPNSAQTAVTGG